MIGQASGEYHELLNNSLVDLLNYPCEFFVQFAKNYTTM